MRTRLLINEVDLTASLIQESWRLDANAFSAFNSLKFVLDDPDANIDLTRGTEVIAEHWSDDTQRVFGGVLTETLLSPSQRNALGREILCTALDWTFLLERALTVQTYRGKSDAEIIGGDGNIFENTDPPTTGFDTSTYVEEVISNTNFLKFDYDPLRAVLDTIADISGAVWYIDPFKRLHYQSFGAEMIGFSLSDNPDGVTSFPYLGIKRQFDFTKIVNHVFVQGGDFRVELADLSEADRIFPNANGDVVTRARYVWQKAEGQEQIEVRRNVGSDVSPDWDGPGALQVVGTARQDTLADHDVLWDYGSRELTWAVAPPNFTNSFRIDADRLIPMLGEALDQESVDQVGSYTYSIRDVTISSAEQAELRAEAELNKRKAEQERVTLRTTKDGLEAGKVVRVVNSVLGIDKNYLIEKLSSRILGGEVWEYQVTLKALVGSA